MKLFFPFYREFDDKLRIKILDEIQSASGWYFDSYRQVYMLPVFTSKGVTNRKEIASSTKNLKWTEEAEGFKFLKKFIITYIFPIIGRGRLMILKTDKFSSNKIHIDCSEEQYYKEMFKYRFVFSGKVSGLYFLDKNRNKVHITDKFREYIIDGAYPHGMLNDIDEVKYTLCMGDPWNITTDQINRLDISKKHILSLEKPEYQNVLKYFSRKIKC